jgi:tetratricopeptide (TPR) repeat protein
VELADELVVVQVYEGTAGLDLVRTLLPGPAALNALQPDLLAVEIVADCLRAERAPTAVAASVSDAQTARAVVLLGRCLARHPDLGGPAQAFITADPVRFLTVAVTALPAVPTSGPLVEVMTAALGDLPPAGPSRIVAALPQRSEALARFAVAATEAALSAATDPQEHARLSAQVAVRLVYLNERTEEAIALARRAVGVLNADDERAEAYDALALALGDGPEAREAGEAAVTLFQALAPNDIRFTGALAHTLHNQSVRLGRGGPGTADLPRALDYARQAERLTADLDSVRPTAFRSLYADVLDNLAQLLAGKGDPTAAQATGRRALALRRTLATARPDAYRPQLAATLHTLAVILGGTEESRALWREATDIYAGLVAERPGRYDGHLAVVRARIGDDAGSSPPSAGAVDD